MMQRTNPCADERDPRRVVSLGWREHTVKGLAADGLPTHRDLDVLRKRRPIPAQVLRRSCPVSARLGCASIHTLVQWVIGVGLVAHQPVQTLRHTSLEEQVL